MEYNFPILISLLPKMSVSDWILLQETALLQGFCIERSDHKVERLLTKIQLYLFSYCKCRSRNIMVLRQNIHISIAMMQLSKKLFRKVKALEFGTRDTLTRAAWGGLLYTTAN